MCVCTYVCAYICRYVLSENGCRKSVTSLQFPLGDMAVLGICREFHDIKLLNYLNCKHSFLVHFNARCVITFEDLFSLHHIQQLKVAFSYALYGYIYFILIISLCRHK